jgi:hypothetical protein
LKDHPEPLLERPGSAWLEPSTRQRWSSPIPASNRKKRELEFQEDLKDRDLKRRREELQLEGEKVKLEAEKALMKQEASIRCSNRCMIRNSSVSSLALSTR